jgi:hypothetical protein
VIFFYKTNADLIGDEISPKFVTSDGTSNNLLNVDVDLALTFLIKLANESSSYMNQILVQLYKLY